MVRINVSAFLMLFYFGLLQASSRLISWHRLSSPRSWFLN